MKAQTVLPFKLQESDEKLTRFAGLPLVAEVFRALGVMKDCDRRLEWKQRRRGLSGGEMVESFMLMLAAGGQCLDDFEQMRADVGLCRLVGHDFPAPAWAWEFLRHFEQQAQPADLREGVFIAHLQGLYRLSAVDGNVGRAGHGAGGRVSGWQRAGGPGASAVLPAGCAGDYPGRSSGCGCATTAPGTNTN